MVYNFRFNIILRVIILIILVVGFVLSLTRAFYLTTAFIGTLLFISVANLIHYVNQTNRDLANFFAGVKYDDFTTTSSAGHRGKSFEELYDGINMINRKFKDIRAEKEANHQFLYTIVEHIDIGLLVIDKNDEVIMMNKALKTLLHKSYLIKLEGLKRVDENFFEIVQNLKAGEKELIKLNINNRLLQLALQSIELTLNKESFRLISFQNLKSELEEQELVAWQKLIRILTHEIMNSVAPISSLSSTVNDIINVPGSLSERDMDQIKSSMNVIKRRSEGLLNFTETYRSLTRIPPPKFQLVDAKTLIEGIHTLFKPQLETKGIVFKSNFPSGPVSFQGDPGLLEQVIINLVKNAMHAVERKENPKIEVYVQKSLNGKVQVQIADNGTGIPEEMLEHIFVPFFTTKEGGSGIGLSLSRQIMRLHKGIIELRSQEGKGTVVSLSV